MTEAIPVVYVVDDEEPVRHSLEVLLRAEGFAVQSFGSGAEALSAAQARRPDCVLTDYHMPDMDGREVIARLARQCAGVPVVVMTGRDDPGKLRLGAHVRLVAKPFDANLLLPMLREMVAGRRGG